MKKRYLSFLLIGLVGFFSFVSAASLNIRIGSVYHLIPVLQDSANGFGTGKVIDQRFYSTYGILPGSDFVTLKISTTAGGTTNPNYYSVYQIPIGKEYVSGGVTYFISRDNQLGTLNTNKVTQITSVNPDGTANAFINSLNIVVPKVYYELSWSTNYKYFDIVDTGSKYLPQKSIFPINTASGIKYLSISNKLNSSLYIPYDSAINCDTYRQNKTAVSRGYFVANCQGCGKFNSWDISGNTVTGYKSDSVLGCDLSSNKAVFDCSNEQWKSSWPVINLPVSDYQYLSCNEACGDWRNGHVGDPVAHGAYITGYTFSTAPNCTSITNAKSFRCDNGSWTNANETTGYMSPDCTNVSVITGSCSLSMITTGTITEFANDNELCDTYSSVTKPLRSSVAYGSTYTWTCVGTGGGKTVNCSKTKWPLYYRYQCQFNSGGANLMWKGSFAGSGSASAKINYNIYDYIYASNKAGDPDYIAGYSCKADGVCGSANNQATVGYPSSNLCDIYSSIVDDDTVGNGGDYNWTCKGLGGALGGADVSCSAPKVAVITGVCNPATNGITTMLFPTTNKCTTFASIVDDDTIGNGGDYNWTCVGTGGGGNASCSAPKMVATNGICGNASGLNFSSLPIDTQLCTTADTITKPLWSSVGYNTNYTWTCNGTGGGTDMTCGLNKVYPYYQYQCQLSGTNSVKRQLVNYPSNGNTTASSSINYNVGQTIYASPTPGNADYVAGYSCKQDGKCGGADGVGRVDAPSSNLCSSGINSSVTTLASGTGFAWTCDGINGGTPATCSAAKTVVANGICGYASGKMYSAFPGDGNLCDQYDTITKPLWSSVGYNSNYTWTCVGTGGGGNMTCGLDKVYPYYQYQCQLSGTNSVKRQLVNYPSNGNTTASSSINYNIGQTIYASPTPGNADYVAGYSCKQDGKCGGADGVGKVDTPTTNLCDSGTNSSVTLSSNTYAWTCSAVNGGTPASCSAPQKIDGKCGSANGVDNAYYPSLGLCASGTISNIDTTGDDGVYNRNCDGINSLNNVSCSANRLYFEYQCQLSGASLKWEPSGLKNKPETSPGNFYVGNKIYTSLTVSSAYKCFKPVDGSCSATHYSCLSGSSINNVGTDAAKYTWSCTGFAGGSDVSCNECKPGYTGANCVLNQCGGTAGIGNIEINATQQIVGNNWTYSLTAGICTYKCAAGSHTEDAGVSCVSNVITTGASCTGYPTSTLGTKWYRNNLSSITQTNTWTTSRGGWNPTLVSIKSSTASNTNCVYNCYAGWTGSNCDLAIQTGVCDNSTKDSCTIGSAISASTSNGKNTWTCQGTNGGNSDTSCYKCDTNYTWNAGSQSCVAISYPGYICIFQGSPGAPKWQAYGGPTSTTKDAAGTYYYNKLIFTDAIYDGTTLVGYTCDPKIAGKCGSASGQTYSSTPNTNLCNSGSESAVTPNTNTYDWACNGLYGSNSNMNCSAYRTVNQTCGTLSAGQSGNNGGTTTYVRTRNGSSWDKTLSWTKNLTVGECNYICKSGWTGSTCESVILDGACGSATGVYVSTTPTTNLCSKGTDSAMTLVNGGSTYTWSCDSSNGGTSANCSAYRLSYPNCLGTLPTSGQNNNGTTTTYVRTGYGNNLWTKTESWTKSTAGQCTYQCKSGWTGDTCNLAITNGSCGAGDGQNKTIPGGTIQNVKDAFAASGLCTYSSITRTASDITINDPKATWSCAGQNGGSSAACTGTYNTSQSTCTAFPGNTKNSFLFSTKSYTNIPSSLTGGKTWSGSSIITDWVATGTDNAGTHKTTTISTNMIYTGIFSCPTEGGQNPTLSSEVGVLKSVVTGYTCMAGYVDFGTNTTDTTAAGVCAAVCPGGTSDDCGAGWSKKGSTAATNTSSYSYSCYITYRGSEASKTCTNTCPTNTYRAGTSRGCLSSCSATVKPSTCDTNKSYTFGQKYSGDTQTSTYTNTITNGSVTDSSRLGTCTAAGRKFENEICGVPTCTDTCSYPVKNGNVWSCQQMVCPSPSTQTLDRTSCDATNTKWTCNINGSCRTASDCVSTQSCDDNGCVTVANSTDNNVCKNYNSNVQVCEAKDQSAGLCGGTYAGTPTCDSTSCYMQNFNGTWSEAPNSSCCSDLGSAYAFIDTNWKPNLSKLNLLSLLFSKTYAIADGNGCFASKTYANLCDSWTTPSYACSSLSSSSACLSKIGCSRTSNQTTCSNTSVGSCTSNTKCQIKSNGEQLGTCVDTTKYSCNNGKRTKADDSCSVISTYTTTPKYMPGISLCLDSQPMDVSCADCSFACKGTSQTKNGIYGDQLGFNRGYNNLYYVDRSANDVYDQAPESCQKKSDAVSWNSYFPGMKKSAKVEYRDGAYWWIMYFCGYKGGLCLSNCAEWKEFYVDSKAGNAYTAGSCDNKTSYNSCKAVSGCRREKQDKAECCTSSTAYQDAGGGLCQKTDSCGISVDNQNCVSPEYCDPTYGCKLPSGGGGCFTAGTMITLSDGSQVGVEKIATGDILIGMDGEKNQVKQLYKIFYQRKLFSINGGKYFVSDTHPFMTIEGWKSFYPEGTLKENPDLLVSMLEVGDVLVTDKGLETIYKLESKYEPGYVYNFKLTGNHTYYADGYLVHNPVAK